MRKNILPKFKRMPWPAERERLASEAKPGEGKAVKLVPV
jgi:hypothetical protein